MAVADSEVSKCIAWNAELVSFGADAHPDPAKPQNHHNSGAIIGMLQASGNYAGCIRKGDMVLTVNNAPKSLTEDNDITTLSGCGTYHGKAAAAGATLSSVAQSLGWSADIWDFSAAVPTLK